MHSFLCKSTLLRVATLALGLMLLPDAATAKPRPGLQKRLIRLMAGTNGALTINRIYCGLSGIGNICVDSLGSTTIGGGYWPKGTADQYVFNSGLQVAGLIGPDGPADWAGDTTGAQLFSPRGDDHGEPVEPIYNATNPDDVTNWPQAAFVPQGDAGEENFNPLLRGRLSASQGDVWFISWEGNPSLSAGRNHPLGVLVEQRGMGWNYPAGNQDILYFIYTFYNVTASDPAAYAAIRPGMREIVQEAGVEFQRLNEARYRIDIPDAGYTLTSMYAAFGADMDVAQADANYSTVVVPFALGNTYEHTFSGTEEWTFDPGIFGPPFFPGAGFVGVKYLKSPIDPATGQEVGLTLFSNTINGGAFDDASNVTQLYRYLSNNISTAAGDAACTFPQATRICYVNSGSPDDMRFFQSSGPLTLAPGGFQSIVVAYIFAAPVAVGACTAPGSCDLTPGDPTRWLSATTLNAGANPVDSVAGFSDYTDANADGVVQQEEVTTVPGSLLGKSLVAQEVFDNRFLLPFAPESPNFFLVGGDNQVTVLWQPSASETSGDPFFAIAQQPTTVPEGGGDPVPNVLFDPNYRQFDVEGYRVYRGRVDAPNSLEMLAQFDYGGTFITDFRGAVNPSAGCAPELGINTVTVDTTLVPPDTTFGCPVPFDSAIPGVAPTVSIDVPLVGPITQVVTVPAGEDRIELANGNVILTGADTAITGAATACATFARAAADCVLDDSGVPFVFVDNTARNNIRYFYSVTAFDINSLQSGPSSLESPRTTKSVTPSALASNFENQVQVTTSLVGRGVVLDTLAPVPQIDPATGIFSGPFPPANGWSVGLGETVAQVLSGETTVSARLDSIQLGHPYGTPEGSNTVPHTYWFSALAAGTSGVLSVAILQQQEIGVETGEGNSPPVVPVNAERSGPHGGNEQFKLTARVGMSLPGADYQALYGRGCVNSRPGFDDPATCPYNGSRWFAGPSPQANETQPHPIAGNTANFSNVPMTNYNNAGALPGVTTIYQTQCYQSAGGASCRAVAGIQSGAKRSADFNLYWGAGGVLDSVIDVTHNVVVPFDSVAGGGWGFLNQASTAVGPGLDATTILTNADFACVEPFRTYQPGGFLCPLTTLPYRLSATAVPGQVGFFSGGGYPPAVGTGGAATPVTAAPGAGFAMWIAGDMFTFELAGGALPAAGTVWSLRQYTGAIKGGNGAAGDLGPYSFSNPEGIRPMTAVGAELTATLNVTNQALATTDEDLSRVHTVPDPYYVTSALEQSTDTKILKFVNLPADCIIRIYSSSGVLVSLLEHHSATFGGSEDWNVRNRNNQVVASGVYFYHIESGDARRVGRFTVVNFAQ